MSTSNTPIMDLVDTGRVLFVLSTVFLIVCYFNVVWFAMTGDGFVAVVHWEFWLWTGIPVAVLWLITVDDVI